MSRSARVASSTAVRRCSPDARPLRRTGCPPLGGCPVGIGAVRVGPVKVWGDLTAVPEHAVAVGHCGTSQPGTNGDLVTTDHLGHIGVAGPAPGGDAGEYLVHPPPSSLDRRGVGAAVGDPARSVALVRPGRDRARESPARPTARSRQPAVQWSGVMSATARPGNSLKRSTWSASRRCSRRSVGQARRPSATWPGSGNQRRPPRPSARRGCADRTRS